MSLPSDPPTAWRRYSTRVFGIDPRSLALLRIGVGLLLLLNLAGLLGDVSAFFTDEGILPRDRCSHLTTEEQNTFPPYWASLHMLSGRAEWQFLLFALMATLAVAVVVGYRTQAALFVSWALLLGLQARNPLILHGGDQLLRCLMFWCLFLPLGSRWSMDSRHRPTVTAPICSLGTFALLVQLGTMYVSTAVAKTHPMWRSDFTALYYALHSDFFTTRFGFELLNYPDLLRLLTASAIGLEFFGPFALLLPWRGWWWRTALVAAFCGLHLGIASTMALGLFPFICIVYWLVFLPAGFWDFLSRRSWIKPIDADGALPVARLSVVTRLVLAAAIVYVIALAVARTRNGPESELKQEPLPTLGKAACLDQQWFLFAPRPHVFGGWIEVPGTRPDGSLVNLLDPSGSTQAGRPPLVSEMFSGMRWRRAMFYLYEYGDCPNLRHGLIDYYRRQYGEPLVAVKIVGVMELTPPPGEAADPSATKRIVLAEWSVEQGYTK
jgi:Vitamin K-dependent gamma-carboxylase